MATQFPIKKGVESTIIFPILDADGDLVTGATGLDSEISKDGGTFADCTNEATEIATASGMYSLILTATETNADIISLIIKTTTADAKTTPIVIYTSAQTLDEIPASVANALLDEALNETTHNTAGTVGRILNWLFRRFFNKMEITTSGVKVYKDNNTDIMGTQTLSDDTTTKTRGKVS